MATRSRLIVNSLRVVWILVTFWFEVGVFFHSVHDCRWPDAGFISSTESASPFHVLLVADPQILDHRSYPSRPAFATYISQLLVDLNLRKNWRAALTTRPDAVVFLGDMMDGGRFDMSDEEYEEYYARFRSIFKLDARIPELFIPGNHDIGIGTNSQFSQYARQRYVSHFGEMNSALSIVNHTLVLLDAPGFVEEDYLRTGASQKYGEWKPRPSGVLKFIKDLVAENDILLEEHQKLDPVVLFTHIPLYRPDGSNCGPLREKGTIRPGVGVGYQNTFGKRATQELLESLQPSVIFSGDDHDYCEYTHKFSPSDGGPVRFVREISVKSLSMAMGIERPGFQLLSLAPEELVPSSNFPVAYADAPCALPNQIRIYLRVYIPLLVVSLFAIFLSNILHSPRPPLRRAVGPHETRRDSRHPARRPHIRLHLDVENSLADEEYGIGSEESLLTPNSPSKSRSRTEIFDLRRVGDLLGEILGYIGCCGGRRSPSKSHEFTLNFLRDVRDVAVFPVGIFVTIAWWISTH